MWDGIGLAVVVVHFAFLAYLLVGGFLAWRWPWTIFTHVPAAIWGVLIVTTKVPCPLTALQNYVRERAGQPKLTAGFIDTYVRGHVYPVDRVGAVRAVVATLVLVSWVGLAIRSRRRAGAGMATS